MQDSIGEESSLEGSSMAQTPTKRIRATGRGRHLDAIPADTTTILSNGYGTISPPLPNNGTDSSLQWSNSSSLHLSCMTSEVLCGVTRTRERSDVCCMCIFPLP